MNVYSTIAAALWGVFLFVWAVASLGAKRTSSGVGKSFLVRLAIALVALLILVVAHAGGWSVRMLVNAPTYGILGDVVCAAGVALAIWARYYLGSNWGMPMSVKENPELVTSGPYAYVRHPIYTGVITAMIGSAIVTGIAWIVPAVLFFLYFYYSAKKEEETMMRIFPDQYPAYKARTKMLIPFIF